MDSETWTTLADRFEATTTLSARQAEVFTLWQLGGYDLEETADRLDISPTTVSRHRTNIKEKLAKSRELAQLSETKPFCTLAGDADSKYVTVHVFENAGRQDDEHPRLQSDTYHVEVIRRSYPDEPHTTRVETTSQYRFADAAAMCDAVQNGLTTDFAEAACLYAAIDEALDATHPRPSLDDLAAMDPDEDELERVLNNGVLSPDDAHELFETPQMADPDVLGTYPGTDIPATFDICAPRVTGVFGMIGAGKTYTAKTLLTRRLQCDDPPNIVYIDMLGSDTAFGPRAGGVTYPLDEGRDAFAAALDDGLADIGTIDICGALDDDADTDANALLVQTVDLLLDHLETVDDPAYIVIEEGHAMPAETWDRLMDAAADSSSALMSWMYIGQPVENLLTDSNTPFSFEDDGVLLHKVASVEEFGDQLSAPQRTFVREANSGKADGPKQVLASSAGSDQWLPVDVDPSLVELAVIADE